MAGIFAVAAVWSGGCTASHQTAHHAVASSLPSSGLDGTTTTTTTVVDVACPQRILTSLTEAQRVGQVFMIGQPLSSTEPLPAVRDQAVGGVVLYGNSRAPVSSVRTLTDRLRLLNRSAVPAIGLNIATDQEGGQIQELSGPGFDAIPSAITQGMTDPGRLRDEAQRWAAQLRGAGVNVDLAPVLDVVPPAFVGVNQPIAHYQRQLGGDPATVAGHGIAVLQGLRASGVGATLKHFPGLGRVAGNTDTSAGVEDTVTTRHDAFVAPFAAAVRSGAEFVMMSLATYRQIDPANRAVFSTIVMNGMLRGDLGFGGLIISDDLGSSQQVLDVPAGERAIRFLNAGGNIVMVVKPPSVVAPMVAAVNAAAVASPAFRRLIEADALAVLTAKHAAGLLGCR